MAVTAEPVNDEEEVPLAVLTADTLAAIDQLRADARAAAEASRTPSSRARLRRRLARLLRGCRPDRPLAAAGRGGDGNGESRRGAFRDRCDGSDLSVVQSAIRRISPACAERPRSPAHAGVDQPNEARAAAGLIGLRRAYQACAGSREMPIAPETTSTRRLTRFRNR